MDEPSPCSSEPMGSQLTATVSVRLHLLRTENTDSRRDMAGCHARNTIARGSKGSLGISVSMMCFATLQHYHNYDKIHSVKT